MPAELVGQVLLRHSDGIAKAKRLDCRVVVPGIPLLGVDGVELAVALAHAVLVVEAVVVEVVDDSETELRLRGLELLDKLEPLPSCAGLEHDGARGAQDSRLH